MGKEPRRLRVALLNNILPPYRIPVYQKIGEETDLRVFLSGYEDNRRTWQELLERSYSFHLKTSWGFTIKRPRKVDGKVIDMGYTFINPGYFWDLIRTRPDAVISTELGPRTLMALLYGLIFRRPVWVWWGGTMHSAKTQGGRKDKLRRWLAPRIRHWISYGASSTEYLLHIGARKEGIVQIQNCVDETLFSPETPPVFEGLSKPVFLHSGQLIKRKGVDLFFKAIAPLKQEGRDFTILMVGGGPETEPLKALAVELGIAENVHWGRECKPHEMPGVYTSADFLIFPTIEDVWGLVANEAMWSGVPVICSIYAGCYPEIIPEENAVDPYDTAAFTEVLRRAFDGKIPKPDPGILRTAASVGQQIVDDMERVCRRK